MDASKHYVPVSVIAILEERVSHNPLVLLLDKENNRVLPILIGEQEANAIMIALYQVPTPRPLTHRLIRSIIVNVKVNLEKIVVSQLKNNTFYAEIYLKRNQENIIIDARPSDAITLALDAKVPLFVSEDVMKEAGQENPLSSQLGEELLTKIVESLRHRMEMSETEPKEPSLTEEEIVNLKKMLEIARNREAGETSGDDTSKSK